MPGNAFVRFKKESKYIEGESKQKGYLGKDGWIEIGDWSWDVEAETSFMKGGGSAVGKPTPGALAFSHYYEKSSKGLFRNIIKGTHFEELELHMCKQTGAATPEPYFKLTAYSVFTTKVSTKGGEDGSVSQDIECVFKKIKIEYFEQDDKGKLTSNNPWTWDIAAMELTGG
jgi:type VI secretion system secreted protein Hcp